MYVLNASGSYVCQIRGSSNRCSQASNSPPVFSIAFYLNYIDEITSNCTVNARAT